MSGWRKIVVNQREWKYQIGQQNVIARAVDNRESRTIDFSKLTGLSWNDIEKGEWKGWFHITPKEIANWLKQPIKP
jgi:hypothetical protein